MPTTSREAGYLDLLVIDDDPDILQLIRQAFQNSMIMVHTVETIAEARDLMCTHSFRVILADQHLNDGNGIDFLAELHETATDTVPILMTGTVDVNMAIAAINKGNVFKVVTKPLELFTLVQTVRRAVNQHSREHDRLRWESDLLELTSHLRREAQSMSNSLRDATKRIHSGEEKLEKQRQHISDLYSELQQSYLRSVMSLMAAINAKDSYTKDHSNRVYYYCSLIANVLGLSDTSRTSLRFASILHDVGKIGIPDAILLKPSALTEEERMLIHSHPVLSDTILEPLAFLAQARLIVRQHHEKYDGSGYPDGLKGTCIAQESLILSVADSFDAMRSERPYRPAMSLERAAAELRAGAGSQFCPVCVEALLFAISVHGEPDSTWASADELSSAITMDSQAVQTSEVPGLSRDSNLN